MNQISIVCFSTILFVYCIEGVTILLMYCRLLCFACDILITKLDSMIRKTIYLCLIFFLTSRVLFFFSHLGQTTTKYNNDLSGYFFNVLYKKS